MVSTALKGQGEPKPSLTECLKGEAWDCATHAFGTAFIFEIRAMQYARRSRVLDFVGIAGPVVFALAAVGFAKEAWWADAFKAGGSIVALAQLVVAIWAMIAGWSNRFANARRNQSSNLQLSNAFRSLARSEAPVEQLKSQLALLEAQNQAQQALDTGEEISEAEKRMGMKAALREFQRQCAACKVVPVSLDPTDCGVCGQFTLPRYVRRR